MSKASELLKRVIETANGRDLFPYYVDGVYHKGDAYTEINGRRFNVSEIHKHNGAEENVSVRIEITELYDAKDGRRIATESVKVPGGASDNVINKRLDKIVEYLNR